MPARATKRRPLWSECKKWAAALACGLLLLNVSPAVLAASQQPSGKPVVAQAAKKPLKKPSKTGSKISRRSVQSAVSVGSAEMLDADTVGLHGKASFYGSGFQGRKTATGERFDARQFTAASNHFPLGSLVAVRRLDNALCAIVKVNDRMAGHHRRIIDVSRGVAEYLQMVRAGVVLVRVAPLRRSSRGQEGGEACHAAFDSEPECRSCGRPLRLPDFADEAFD